MDPADLALKESLLNFLANHSGPQIKMPHQEYNSAHQGPEQSRPNGSHTTFNNARAPYYPYEPKADIAMKAEEPENRPHQHRPLVHYPTPKFALEEVMMLCQENSKVMWSLNQKCDQSENLCSHTLNMIDKIEKQQNNGLDIGVGMAKMDVTKVLSMMHDLKQENVELRKEIASLKRNMVINSGDLADQVVAKVSNQMMQQIHLKFDGATNYLVAHIEASSDRMLKHYDNTIQEAMEHMGSYTPQ